METTLERYLAEQGWCGVDLPVVMIEVALAYLTARLDAAPVRRHLDGMVGDDILSIRDCRHVLVALFREAERADRLGLLARPGSRDVADAMMALNHLCEDDRKDEPRARNEP